MSEKIFLHLLILCGIWSQGIIGIFADEEIKQSSDFLHRQKRVVSYLPGEDVRVGITGAPHIVYITQNGNIHCVGNILSQYVVITAASCVSTPFENFKVRSSTVRTAAGINHDIIQSRKHIDDPHRRNNDGIDLVVVNPRFVFTQYCQPIRLHLGAVLVGTFGKVLGWGYNVGTGNHGTTIQRKLRSIEVPVISHQNCVNRYRPHLELSDKTVCTYHPLRHSGHSDKGAGLIIDGALAGIFLWSGLNSRIDPQFPDVFAYLPNPYYNHWIRSNVESIDSHFDNLYRQQHAQH